MSENKLELWSKVEKTDPNFTKEVSFGRKFTAIDPYYQIKNATEQFGAYGDGFGLVDIVHDYITLKDEKGLSVLVSSATFFYTVEKKVADGTPLIFPNKFPLTTSSKMFSGKTPKYDEDIFKKAETDLLTKALSKLGFNADIFTGKFEDNRYVANAYQEAQLKEERSPATEEQIKEITYLMEQTDSDQEKMLSYVKIEKIEDLSVSNFNNLKRALLLKLNKKDEK